MSFDNYSRRIWSDIKVCKNTLNIIGLLVALIYLLIHGGQQSNINNNEEKSLMPIQVLDFLSEFDISDIR